MRCLPYRCLEGEDNQEGFQATKGMIRTMHFCRSNLRAKYLIGLGYKIGQEPRLESTEFTRNRSEQILFWSMSVDSSQIDFFCWDKTCNQRSCAVFPEELRGQLPHHFSSDKDWRHMGQVLSRLLHWSRHLQWKEFPQQWSCSLLFPLSIISRQIGHSSDFTIFLVWDFFCQRHS